MRVSGLSSGIDYESIITKMMDAQRVPVDRLKQQQQLLEWKRDDYRALNSKILEFKNLSFDMKLPSVYGSKKATSSDENSVAATGSSTSGVGQYSIEVKKLAKAASFNTGQLGATTGGTTKLSDIGWDLGDDEVATIEINGAASSVTITKDTTINDLVSAINKKSTTSGVKVTYDATMDRMFFNSTKVGANSEIKLEIKNADGAAASQDLTNLLKMTGGTADGVMSSGAVTPTTGGFSVKGVNAEVVFNGGITQQYESNTFTIAGINFTAKNETTGAVQINVSQDIDSVVDKIKNYVEKYNALIDEVNKETSEKVQRNYKPLTDAQREEMSDEDIKRWEEKARSGMLSRDSLLNDGLTKFRRAFSDTVGGLPADQLKTLSEIGISSTNIVGSSISGSYLDKGKLYIDEDKLRKAITENPDQVAALFTKDDAATSGDGVAVKLYDQASALVKQITDKAGTVGSADSSHLIGKDNQRLSEQIALLEIRMIEMENRYYKQFTAMENYINKMNSQGSWLSQQL
ncbi:flagellar filament capping protein FliD [Paenibacillus soyae]|uniref:Flagellar hook-associated protein 2 n=1 Tax=Paenibacillus soyae TaxID=2969249 RepID=A0A9X2MUW6_9BACL|nr:flagellar filament capping protein FliD [Paenibacillus soyae]MCR2806729.1 flagellar filament capping protein FliD [Paenibacillus soyae]